MVDLPLPVSPTSATVCPAETLSEKSENFLAGAVVEPVVVELDVAPDVRPVFAARLEAVAESFDDLGRIRDLRLRLQHAHHALCRRLRRLQIGKDARDVADRLEDAGGILHKRRQRADGDQLRHVEHVLSALPEHQRRRHRAQTGDDRHEQRAQHRGADGGRAHDPRQLREFLAVRPAARLRVLVVLAPMMPSLNAPVMREFVLRTVR